MVGVGRWRPGEQTRVFLSDSPTRVSVIVMSGLVQKLTDEAVQFGLLDLLLHAIAILLFDKFFLWLNVLAGPGIHNQNDVCSS